MKNKLVLISGGIDSTVLLHKVVDMHGPQYVKGLSVFYGQKHKKELEFAQYQCTRLGVTFQTLDLSNIFVFNKNLSALLEGSEMEIKKQSYADQLADLGGSGTVSAYVPYRNGLFLSVAASYAIQEDCDTIYYGAHRDDAAGRAYPDCTVEFVASQADAIAEGSGYLVELEAPWIMMAKKEIVNVGRSLNVDFTKTWSCYFGAEKPCGVCGTCVDVREALDANGLEHIIQGGQGYADGNNTSTKLFTTD
jgi:7-cyano-7-deazaguanine synthase